MKSLYSLAVFYGIYLTAFKLANSKEFISENMKADVENLTIYFNITSDMGLFGNPIFLKHLHSEDGKIEVVEQKLLVQEILDLYVNILSNMMNRTKDSNVKKSITRIRSRLDHLRSSCFQHREKHLKQRLQDLWAMKINDSTVQRKAMRELIPVFQKVSMLVNKNQDGGK